jgi:intracellular sulfur oxidation DsrE/DsrF family protein
MYAALLYVHHTKEDAMGNRRNHLSKFMLVFAVSALLGWPWIVERAMAADGPGKVKVLYHVDGKDPEVAKYALALINKHIDAEGGPDKIDVELVVHGIDNLAKGFVATLHPVAVKRIADLQKEGYLYIKP